MGERNARSCPSGGEGDRTQGKQSERRIWWGSRRAAQPCELGTNPRESTEHGPAATIPGRGNVSAKLDGAEKVVLGEGWRGW